MDHIERLREMRAPYACMAESHEGEPDGETFAACVAAIDAAITALSARASAGEGGDWVRCRREERGPCRTRRTESVQKGAG